jgi:hypothetical protein
MLERATTSDYAVSERPAVPFTAPERELLRRELRRHFGEDPSIADGIFLRTWRGGRALWTRPPADAACLF